MVVFGSSNSVLTCSTSDNGAVAGLTGCRPDYLQFTLNVYDAFFLLVHIFYVHYSMIP